MHLRPPRTRWSLALLLLAGLSPGCGLDVVDKADTGAPAQDTAPVDSTSDSQDAAIADDTGCADGGSPDRLWYRDADGDAYGRSGDSVSGCEPPSSGFVADPGDCDDDNAAAYPGAPEICDDVDNNCDGTIDEGFDADGDGYRDPSCPGGTDCDDADPSVNPAETDTCGDGIDSDCDGADAACAYKTDLGDADVKLWATGATGDAGHHMDWGDINGDGVEDLVVGAMWADSYEGNAWVVSGPISGDSAFSDVAIKIAGGHGSYEGARTVGVGDTTGDGYDDILLGAPDATSWDAVVVFGPVTADMEFADADLLTYCTATVECGHGGDIADVDGDGIDDAVIAAGEANTGGYSSGSVYILYGPLSAETIALQSDADVEMVGETPASETGRIDAAGGDLDGDGIGDIIITASYDSEGGPDAGAVHVVFGPVTDTLDLGDSDGKLLGAAPYDYAGEALSMGDVDGDGKADVEVGAYASARGSGHAYAVYGPATGTVSLSAADVIISGTDGEGLGSALSARDVDGDGTDELLVGANASNSGGRGSGGAYLFVGPLAGALAPTDALAAFTGESPHDAAGSGVDLADLNGDGEPDVVVGATSDATGGPAAGAVFGIYSPL